VFYGFGALVLLAAVRMFRSQPIADPGNSLVVRGLRRVLPVTPGYVGGRFLVRAGAIMATPLLVALVAFPVGLDIGFLRIVDKTTNNDLTKRIGMRVRDSV
jgi:hypothetical protein